MKIVEKLKGNVFTRPQSHRKCLKQVLFFNSTMLVSQSARQDSGSDTGKETGLNWNKERVLIWLVARDTHETVKTMKNKEAMTTMSLNYDMRYDFKL